MTSPDPKTKSTDAKRAEALARKAAALRDQVIDLLGTPPVRPRAPRLARFRVDEWIRAQLPASLPARRLWARAEALWWEMALLPRSRAIARAEAKRHARAGARSGRLVEDLESDALEGVYRAAQTWDPDAASGWSTWAGGGARLRIHMRMREGGDIVTIPQNTRVAGAEYRRHQDAGATRSEAAASAGISLEVAEALDGVAHSAGLSCDAPVPGSEGRVLLGTTLGDPDAPSLEEAVIERIDTERKIGRVRLALDLLSERQRQVLRGRSEELSVSEIARPLGVCAETIRQSERRALTALRAHLGAEIEPEEPDARMSVPLAERVRAVLARGPMTASAVAAQLGVSPRSAWRALDGVAIRGSVGRDTAWELPKPEPAATPGPAQRLPYGALREHTTRALASGPRSAGEIATQLGVTRQAVHLVLREVGERSSAFYGAWAAKRPPTCDALVAPGDDQAGAA